MGNEASKQEPVEPPPEWDPESNAKKFELVSPMSDLSDPSMFLHRSKPHPKQSDTPLQQVARKKPLRAAREPPARMASELATTRKGPGAARQTPAGDRRRKSKVIATRDSAYKHEPRQRELAPPSSFYFPSEPTRESEETFNRIMTRKYSSSGPQRHSKKSSNDNNRDTNAQANKENNIQQKNTPLLLKAKRNVNKATICLTGCFEESSQRIQLMRDNAHHDQRGQRLSSELGGEHREVTLKLPKQGNMLPAREEEKDFDPYRQNPLPVVAVKPTVLQFIDGSEKELAFNPVWRESHDGTYHEMSTATGVGRESEPTTTTTTASDAQRRMADLSDQRRRSSNSVRQPKVSVQRLAEPPSQMRDDLVSSNKEGKASLVITDAPDDEASSLSKSQNKDAEECRFSKGDDDENTKVTNLISMYNRRKSSDTDGPTQRRFSTDITNANVEYQRQNSIATSASAATSHESTYWDDFYKDAQVLHHEDRVAYHPRRSSGGSSMATPVMALFGPVKQKSLLGDMPTTEAAGDKSQAENFAIEAPTSNDPSTAKNARDDEFGKKEKVSAQLQENERQAALVQLFRPKRRSNPVDLDITPKSSVMGFSGESANKNGAEFHSMQRQPSDEEMDSEDDLSKAVSAGERPMDEPPLYSKSCDEFAQMEKPSLSAEEIEKGGKVSFLGRRISANQVLAETKLVTNAAKSGDAQPTQARLAIKAALQETPRASTVEPRASFGSAFSYKDKDVFTPVTSSTTYPKGSPFRPRVNVPSRAMAKAKLDQPAMYTQSFDNMSRSSRDMQIQATESLKSAPSMIETHDYRDIAFGCFLQDTPSTIANKKERALAPPTPSVISLESPMSTVMSPGQPLLSEQAMNNAAFLFSPSYASANSLLTLPSQRDIIFNASSLNDVDAQGNALEGFEGPRGGLEEPHDAAMRQIAFKPDGKKRESTFSISTLGSRSRVSTRSQRSITIPLTNSGNNALSPRNVGSRKSSISDAASQKSVRFSDVRSIDKTEAGSQKSRRSVTWDFSFKKTPADVSIPAIETTVSDLSDAAFGMASVESAGSKRDSVESFKSGLRQRAIEEEEEETASLKSGLRQLAIEEEEETDSLMTSETASRPSLASVGVSEDSFKSNAESTGTPEEPTRTWKYCEFSKGVTPMLDRKQLAQVTNSPVLRFKAAKNKFVGKKEKALPAKKNSPSIYKRKAVTGRVHLLASKFDNGGPPLEPQSMGFKTQRATAPSEASSATLPDGRKMLRTPQILGYTAKAYPNIWQQASFGSVGSNSISTASERNPKPVANTEPSLPVVTATSSFMMSKTPLITNKKSVAPFYEIPDDTSDDSSQKSCESQESTDSTFIQSVATIRQEGREDRYCTATAVVEDDDSEDRLDMVLDEILESSESTESHADFVQENEEQEDVPGDEAADDFAELLLNNLLGEDSSREESPAVTAPRESECSHQLRSMISNDEDEDSTYTHILAAPSFSDESTTMSVVLAQQTTANLRHGAKTVQPHVQKQHQSHRAPLPQALNLSPLQRTPMQASKWRELAENAAKTDSKRNIFRSSKKGKGKKGKEKSERRLSERDTNVL